MRNVVSLLIVGLLLLARPAAAPAQQQSSSGATGTPATISASHLAAARELLELLRIEEAAMAGVMVALEQQVQASPALNEYRDVMRSWAREIFASEEARAAFGRLYAEELSEADLQELIVFYRSDVGQRLAAKQPVLTTRGAEVGQRLAEAREADLVERLQQRERELRDR